MTTVRVLQFASERATSLAVLPTETFKHRRWARAAHCDQRALVDRGPPPKEPGYPLADEYVRHG